MKIVHVLLTLKMGGAERMAVELAARQTHHGHRVAMVLLTPEPDAGFAKRLAEVGVEWIVVPKRHGLDLTLSARLLRAFLARRPDVVHTHNRAPLIYATAPARAVGAKVVHTRHGAGLGSEGEGRLRRLAGTLVHAYVGVSAPAAAVAKQAGDARPDKIRVIENGVDVASFAFDPARRLAVRSALGIAPGAWVVGSVGRLVAEKDYGVLIRAAKPYLGGDSRLVFVGAGPEEGPLRQIAEREAVGPFVVFAGPQQDIAGHLSALDVFALSSKTEGLPMALLEAMSNGRPIVATAVGGIPRVVKHGESGLLAPAGDEAALGAALGSLRESPPTAERMGQLGLAFVRDCYGLEQMVNAYMNLYRQVGARA